LSFRTQWSQIRRKATPGASTFSQKKFLPGVFSLAHRRAGFAGDSYGAPTLAIELNWAAILGLADASSSIISKITKAGGWGLSMGADSFEFQVVAGPVALAMWCVLVGCW